jgi:hypothetical protein
MSTALALPLIYISLQRTGACQSTTVSRVLAARIGLGYLAVSSAYVGLWILLAPRGFYDTFPSGPAEWVSALPPFNEHLLRDFGAAATGLTVLAVLAAVWLERRLVQATAIAFLVYSLPHLGYHLTTTDRYSTADNAQSLTGLLLPVLVSLGLLWASRGGFRAAEPAPPPAPSSGARR